MSNQQPQCVPDFNLQDLKEKILSVVTHPEIREKVEKSNSILRAWSSLQGDTESLYRAMPLIREIMIAFAANYKECQAVPKAWPYPVLPVDCYGRPVGFVRCTTGMCQFR